MATVVTREAYFRTGIEILAALGYGGLKLAEVCERLGVTTGSFYHYFTNWAEYTHELVEDCIKGLTDERAAALMAETDPYRRIDSMIDVGLGLPHDANAAVRSWGSVAPRVRAVVVSLDQIRYQLVRVSALEILGDPRQADVVAKWAVYLLVGYEQTTLPRDQAAFTWLAKQQFRRALEPGNMTGVPD
ncbi:TetR/AcrR family transcriptional regulator [soil metagenome]